MFESEAQNTTWVLSPQRHCKTVVSSSSPVLGSLAAKQNGKANKCIGSDPWPWLGYTSLGRNSPSRNRWKKFWISVFLGFLTSATCIIRIRSVKAEIYSHDTIWLSDWIDTSKVADQRLCLFRSFHGHRWVWCKGLRCPIDDFVNCVAAVEQKSAQLVQQYMMWVHSRGDTPNWYSKYYSSHIWYMPGKAANQNLWVQPLAIGGKAKSTISPIAELCCLHCILHRQ